MLTTVCNLSRRRYGATNSVYQLTEKLARCCTTDAKVDSSAEGSEAADSASDPVAASGKSTNPKKAFTPSRRPSKADVAHLSHMSYNVNTAVEKVQSLSWAKFDESVEIAVNLGVDPRKQTQMVKGVARLPHGTGKQKRIGVFATGGDAQAALEAGADVVGGEELIARIQRGELPFDTAIATPEMMSQVSKIGRILGPRSMMPNPKMGTVTKDITKAVNAAKAGQVQFRVEKKGIVHAGIGKVSFSKEALLDNIRAFMIAIGDHKPENFKGDYLLGVSMSSTMGPGIKVAKSSIDPSKASFMVEEGEL